MQRMKTISVFLRGGVWRRIEKQAAADGVGPARWVADAAFQRLVAAEHRCAESAEQRDAERDFDAESAGE